MVVVPSNHPSKRSRKHNGARKQPSASSRKLFVISRIILGIVATAGWLYLIATAIRALAHRL
jgi:hypothetical protein